MQVVPRQYTAVAQAARNKLKLKQMRLFHVNGIELSDDASCVDLVDGTRIICTANGTHCHSLLS